VLYLCFEIYMRFSTWRKNKIYKTSRIHFYIFISCFRCYFHQSDSIADSIQIDCWIFWTQPIMTVTVLITIITIAMTMTTTTMTKNIEAQGCRCKCTKYFETRQKKTFAPLNDEPEWAPFENYCTNNSTLSYRRRVLALTKLLGELCPTLMSS